MTARSTARDRRRAREQARREQDPFRKGVPGAYVNSREVVMSQRAFKSLSQGAILRQLGAKW